MSKIHGNGFAPFRFFTPFPRRPPRYISEGQWRENRMLRLLDSKTRIFFPSEEKDTRFQAPLSSPAERNRARSAFKRFFPPISLRRIGKLISLGQKWSVFGIHCPELLKHTRRPISSASLDGRFGKAKSSRSLLPFPCISPTQYERKA
jgi:hypothetical protein